MFKKVETVHIFTCDDNTELRIPIDTLLDKLSIDIWSDIHRYKDSFPEEFAIGKISEEYAGWTKMPIDNKLFDKFLERYFVNSEIKLLCDFDCNVNNTLYIVDSYVRYDDWTICVTLNKEKNGIQLYAYDRPIINGGKLTAHQPMRPENYRIYCMYIRE